MKNVEFTSKAKENPVELKDDLYYVVVKVDKENVKMSEKFLKQLENENKYGMYVGIVTTKQSGPFEMDEFPIYGRTDKYELKHLKSTKEEAIKKDLRDKGLGLLSRLK